MSPLPKELPGAETERPGLDASLAPLRMALLTPYLGPLASKMVREYISVVQASPLVVHCYGRAGKLIRAFLEI